MTSYRHGFAYCKRCEKYVIAEGRCECGNRLRTKPSRKKLPAKPAFYTCLEGYRCGNCMSMLHHENWKTWRCTNEECGQVIELKPIIKEVVHHGEMS